MGNLRYLFNRRSRTSVSSCTSRFVSETSRESRKYLLTRNRAKTSVSNDGTRSDDEHSCHSPYAEAYNVEPEANQPAAHGKVANTSRSILWLHRAEWPLSSWRRHCQDSQFKFEQATSNGSTLTLAPAALVPSHPIIEASTESWKELPAPDLSPVPSIYATFEDNNLHIFKTPMKKESPSRCFERKLLFIFLYLWMLFICFNQ